MKNKFLLLGATALLSTCLVMGAFADGEPSTTLNVSVGIAVKDAIASIQDIDFGTYVLDADELEDDFDQRIDPITGKGSSYATERILGKQQNGQVMLVMRDNSLLTIQLPEEVILTNYEGHHMVFYPEFEQISENGDYFIQKIFGIGGRSSNRIHGDLNPLFPGKYTGVLTVTAVASEEPVEP